MSFRTWFKRIALTLCSVVCTTLHAAPPDLTGIWMPTAIAPDGSRNTVWPQKLPFTKEAQAIVDRYRADYDALEDDTGRNCLPYGMPQQMLVVAQYPLEFIQTPQRLTLLFELHNDARRVYFDTRQHPQGLLPSWMGHSVGWYEGDTLVIETVGVRSEGAPRPHSPLMKLTERFHEVEGGTRGRMLKLDMTIEDPLVYATPITLHTYFRREKDIEMGEYFCSDDLWQQSQSGDQSQIPWR